MKYLVIIASLFVLGSLSGYIIELFFRRFVSQHRWVNPGFMVGPYIPLYGFGVVILYGLSNINLSGLNIAYAWQVVIKILLIGVGMTLIELIAGLIFIRGLHIKLWDYSNRWGNYKGIICPLFSFIWLVAGAAYYFLLNPILIKGVGFISENLIYSFFVGLVCGMMIVDFAYSLHIGIKVKKAAGELTVKYEEFKVQLHDKAMKEQEHSRFFGGLVSLYKNTNELKNQIALQVEKLPKPKKWWKKEKKDS
ncbi:MAG: putative ABC transporter permease [Bacilli bacterium]|nr:putative ABC transporter permease [Bacilli bacterium]